MSIKAFGSLRVTESLTAIGDYLHQAIQIAEGVPPGQIIKPNLEPVPVTPSPRLTRVLWVRDDGTSSSIPVGELEEGDVVATVVVSGLNLAHQDEESGQWVSDIKAFKLVGPGAGAPYFEANTLTPSSATEFTAELEVVRHHAGTDPPLGSYDAWVVSVAGQPFLLRDACFIEEDGDEEDGDEDEDEGEEDDGGDGDDGGETAAAADVVERGAAKPALKLGGLFPNEFEQEGEFTPYLAVLRGQVSRIFVEDFQTKQEKKGWVKSVQTDSRHGTTGVTLRLVVPKLRGERQPFYLVAESPNKTSDRLMFVVKSSSEAGI